MNNEEILLELAKILRNNGYKVYKREYYDENSLPSINAWLDDTKLTARAWNAIKMYYTGYIKGTEEKTMQDLIEDVKSGEITNHRNIGAATKHEIANAMRTSLKIDV